MKSEVGQRPPQTWRKLTKRPFSVSKIMGTDLMWFAVRMWDLRITNLMQGPVCGLETEASRIDEHLRTLFNYDEIFGTIFNRFIVQTLMDYPLTVYGKAGQTLGYLNINDTLQCVHMSEKLLAKKGELRFFNQIMETFSANELAEKVQKVGKKLVYDVKIDHIKNSRREAEEHYYNPTYQGLIELGVEPHYLAYDVLERMFQCRREIQG